MEINTPGENTKQSARFRGEVLNRIYRVWLFRKFLPVLIGEVILFSVILYILGRAVFIQRVLENALAALFLSPPQALSFLVATFSNASAATQVLTLLAAVLTAFLIRHLTQGVLRFILVRQNYFGKATSQ